MTGPRLLDNVLRLWPIGSALTSLSSARPQTVDAVQRAVTGDDPEVAAETRKRARQCGPDCVELLHHVVITDKIASIAQRVRAASTRLEAGGFLSSEPRSSLPRCKPSLGLWYRLRPRRSDAGIKQARMS
jgi:hypothetical protein